MSFVASVGCEGNISDEILMIMFLIIANFEKNLV